MLLLPISIILLPVSMLLDTIMRESLADEFKKRGRQYEPPLRQTRLAIASLLGMLLIFSEWVFRGVLTGYGYGLQRLIVMLTALWLAGGVIYGAASEQGLMAPTNPIVFNDRSLRQACASNWTNCQRLPKEHTAFGPWFFSLDVLIPVIGFGLERDWAPIYALPCSDDPKACAPDFPQGSVLTLSLSQIVALPAISLPAGFLWMFYWVQVVFGWLFTALLAAVISGVMKRD